MAAGPQLVLRQAQTLTLTPELRQAIGLLALTNVELEAALGDAVAANPLLAWDGEDGVQATAPTPEREEAAGTDEQLAGAKGLDDSPYDAAWTDDGWEPTGSEGAGDGPDWERASADEPSLAEHLLAQLGALPPPERAVAEAIVGELDETGYLPTLLAEIADRTGVPRATAERALAAVQACDPPGIAARDLAECLRLQAIAADRHDPCMAKLIANLPLLARGDLNALRRLCEVDDEDLRDMIAELRSYDPKPGCRFRHDPGERQTALPDLLVIRARAGWAVQLNPDTLPRLRFDRARYGQLRQRGRDRTWLGQAKSGAERLLASLEQRARTLQGVGEEIVRAQAGFFERGAAGMRTLSMADVAAKLGVHESTVSRIAANKWLHCERGLFPLRQFFSLGAVETSDGDGASAESVKARIRALIAGEGAKPLSDDALAEALAKEGVEIARRTVAKYREACGIGSSAERRRRARLDKGTR